VEEKGEKEASRIIEEKLEEQEKKKRYIHL
jgi:hypothetical protein